MQAAKIIDVKRSFIPINPNSYPEGLHSTDGEDSPEQRVPVVAYKGFNFMPTSVGYRSYFGLNSSLEVDSLSPNEADAIFIFQTLTYKNVVVALCDTGIFVKHGTDTGAWEQLVTMAAPGDNVFYEWTYTIVKNVLYCFRANDSFFYKIETDLVATNGVAITPIVPTFITLSAQLGMFRLGQRLAFWDANNAIAWSNPDDYSDFTPAVLTGASVTTFNSILGRISAIRSHGKNAIVYSTKSFVALEVQPTETFFVKATPLLVGAGCAYLKNSVEAVPDTTHFAFTSSGIYKIENGKPDVIIPEIYDFLKDAGNMSPVYLKLLQGRYLAFEVIDDVMDGRAQFSTVVIPADTLSFDSLDDVNDIPQETVTDDLMCSIIGSIDNEAFNEQQAHMLGDPAYPAVPAPRKAGTSVQPLYTCYLSIDNGPPAEPYTWITSPCGAAKMGGGFYTPSPADNHAQLSRWNTGATNKTPIRGDEAYVDGLWTMERFIAYQTAIWRIQQNKMTSFLESLLARFESSTSSTAFTNTCAPSSPTPSLCDLGTYPTAYAGPKFGFNKCSFWLTRFATQAVQVNNRVADVTACTNAVTDIGAPSGYFILHLGDPFAGPYGSLAAAVADFQAFAGGVITLDPLAGTTTITGTGGNTTQTSNLYTLLKNGVPQSYTVCAGYTAAAHKIVTGYVGAVSPALPAAVFQAYPAGYYDQNVSETSMNVGTIVPPGVIAIETAWCELTHYKYTDAAGVVQIVAARSCDATIGDFAPEALNPSANRTADQGTRNPLNEDDGSMCGIPYEPPPLLADVQWEDQSLVYPPSHYLLQDGSISPRWPTFVGAFVYDLHLKKWGKMRGAHKQLLDYSPINSDSKPVIAYNTFGIVAAAYKDDGFIWLFDDRPEESEITYGKIGFYRAGMTDIQEIRADFSKLATGYIKVDVSMDGQAIATDLSETFTFTGERQAVVHPSYSGKWFNVTIGGNYDLVHTQYNGMRKGRR